MIVNQPDFTLKVFHNGSQVWTTKVVIGDPAASKQTPLLSETMKSITINPTWNVPPSIVYGEYLPALARDPTVLARMGLNVTYGPDGSVVNISQPPGGANVLGRVRFNFPKRFLVYQHDTNEKFMFAHEVRAYSHGCMRVQDPAKYADVLLNLARPSEHRTVERVTRMFGAGEQDIQLPPAAIWVHMTYQSAFVDDTGKLQTPARCLQYRRPPPAVAGLRWQCDQGAPKEDWRLCPDPGLGCVEGCARCGAEAKPHHAHK